MLTQQTLLCRRVEERCYCGCSHRPKTMRTTTVAAREGRGLSDVRGGVLRGESIDRVPKHHCWWRELVRVLD